jgi:NADH-quinone oxidoreductase subunit M
MIVVLIFWPLAAALLLFAARPARVKQWAFVASLIELLASLILIFRLDKDGSVQFVTRIPWIDSLGVDFYVGADGISVLLVLLTTVMVPFIILSSFDHPYQKPHSFYGLVPVMQMALVGVFTARDGFLFYIFWELALIPIYFICLIWGGDNRAKVTLKFFHLYPGWKFIDARGIDFFVFAYPTNAYV